MPWRRSSSLRRSTSRDSRTICSYRASMSAIRLSLDGWAAPVRSPAPAESWRTTASRPTSRAAAPPPGQHRGGAALALAGQPEQEVLGADVVVAQLQRLAQRQLQDLLVPGGERQVAAGGGPPPGRAALHPPRPG